MGDYAAEIKQVPSNKWKNASGVPLHSLRYVVPAKSHATEGNLRTVSGGIDRSEPFELTAICNLLASARDKRNPRNTRALRRRAHVELIFAKWEFPLTIDDIEDR